MTVKAYLDENYGRCERQSCTCLTRGWMGTRCESWKPFGASTYEELAEVQRNLCGNIGVKQLEVKPTTIIEEPIELPSLELHGSSLTE